MSTPLPSYLCNPANALDLSIEEKDLPFCTRIDRWPLPLPSPTYDIGLSMEENDLLLMAHQSTAHSSKHTNKTLERLCRQQEPISIIN